MPLTSVDPRSLVGRIHELIGELHASGRMSSADVSLIHSLTQNRDLPSFFREERSSPLIVGDGTGGDLMPAVRCSPRSKSVTVNVAGCSDPEMVADVLARAFQQNDKFKGPR